MIAIDVQTPPAIIELRADAEAIARLRLYGDDCVLMGWTGDYKRDAPVAVFLDKADGLLVDRAQAVTILLEQTENEVTDWRMKYVHGEPRELAEFLSVTCPALAQRFPETLNADGDEPTTPEQFHTRMLNFAAQLY